MGVVTADENDDKVQPGGNMDELDVSARTVVQ